jgi:A/G-specific adenine glycosylase
MTEARPCIYLPISVFFISCQTEKETGGAINSQKKKALRFRLLRWYGENQRPMPWRETRDAYRIWISEIMLQQTQVKTVREYYENFIRRFPDVQSLAMADIQEVMKAWEGLGYYSRARNLHRAARDVISRYDGRIPDSYREILSLPGVGRYTAGAVLSIAYGQRVPVLDGNVIRVLTRLFHITDDVNRTHTRRRLWELAGELVPDQEAALFNQALMELGALVCRPRDPGCDSCPLRGLCRARSLRIQEELPVKPARKVLPHYDVTAGVIRNRNKILITLRPARGLLGGLWEFPGGKREEGEDLESCLRREIREELGIPIRVEKPLLSVRHAYSHFRITLHVFQCRYLGGSLRLRGADDYRWVTPGRLNRYAFPAADRAVIRYLTRQEKGEEAHENSSV